MATIAVNGFGHFITDSGKMAPLLQYRENISKEIISAPYLGMKIRYNWSNNLLLVKKTIGTFVCMPLN